MRQARKKLLLKWTAALCLVLVAYGLLGFFALPRVVKSAVEKGVPDAIHRSATVDAVSFNPFTLLLTVDGLTIRERDSNEPLASVGRLVADVSYRSIPSLALVLSEVRIQDPIVRLEFYKDGSNISDIVVGREKPAESKKPLPVVVNNFSVEGGRIEVRDHVLDQSHAVEAINLVVPFLSDLARDRERFVEPVLQGQIDGYPFSLKGRVLPFADKIRAEFDVALHNLELPRYTAYIPAGLHLGVDSGVLNSQGSIVFEQAQEGLPHFFVQGEVKAERLGVHGPSGKLFQAKALTVGIDRLAPLSREMDIRAVKLQEPWLRVVIAKDGRPELPGMLDSAPRSPKGAGEDSSGTKEASPAGPQKFLVQAGQIELAQGTLVLDDKSRNFSRTWQPLDIVVQNGTTKPGEATRFTASLGKDGAEHFKAAGAVTAEPFSTEGNMTVAGMRLQDYVQLLPPSLPVRIVAGVLDSQLAWAMPNKGPDKGQGQTGAQVMPMLKDPKLSLRDLHITAPGGGPDILALASLTVAGGSVDLGGKSGVIKEVRLEQGEIRAVRDKDGIDLANLLAQGQSEGQPAQGHLPEGQPKPAATAGQDAWKFVVESVALKGWGATLEDRTGRSPTTLRLADLELTTGKVDSSLTGEIPVKLSGGLGTGGKGGRLAADAFVRPGDKNVRGKASLEAIDLSQLNGLLPQTVKLVLASGKLSTDGEFAASQPAGASGGGSGGELSANYRGTLGLTQFSVRGEGKQARELVAVQRLAVEGLQFTTKPLALAASSVAIAAPRLDIQRGRDGSIDLMNLLGEGNTAAGKTAAQPVRKVASRTSGKATGKMGGTTGQEPGDKLQVAIGRLTFQNGAVRLRDNSVDPPFFATMDKVAGHVETISLTDDKPATFTLDAVLNGRAPLHASGSVKIKDVQQDAAATVSLKDFAMKSLSPYTAKYLGYPVRDGAFNTDTTIQISNRNLTGQSVVRIEKLDLGDKVDSPDAKDVPVKAALSVLKDVQGNVDLTVPLSGNMDDPHFGLERVIAGAFQNTLTKVALAPFTIVGSTLGAVGSFLGGTFGGGGGGEDLREVAFEPGLATLDEKSRDKLLALAGALKNRPGIRLEVAGSVDPDTDRPGLVEAKFQQLIKREKLADQTGQGGRTGLLGLIGQLGQFGRRGKPAPAQGEDVDKVQVSSQEYPRYLKQAYEAAEFDKPTNVVGIEKSQPVEVMERLLKEHIEVGDSDLSDLAAKRAEAVQHYLVTAGVNPDQVMASQSSGFGGSEGGTAGAKAELKLGTGQ